MVREKIFALIGYLGRMRGGLVGGHRTGVREDTEVEKVDINSAPVHQYCHKGTNCAGIQSQS